MSITNTTIAALAFITVYTLSLAMNQLQLSLLLLAVSPLILVGLIYFILKSPHKSDKTFESHFYEDHPRKRKTT